MGLPVDAAVTGPSGQNSNESLGTVKVSGDACYTGLMWNKERIQQMLQTNPRAVERAIVAIYERQTADEKATSHTRHDNSVGFRSNHASKGSYYARWVKSGRQLTGFHLQNARTIAMQYHRQLCDIANSKQREAFSAPVTTLSAERLAQVNADEDVREARKAAFEDHDVTQPPAGSWASVARIMAAGDDSDFDWDAWKDQMKEADVA